MYLWILADNLSTDYADYADYGDYGEGLKRNAEL
jgi:hypothetical protein